MSDWHPAAPQQVMLRGGGVSCPKLPYRKRKKQPQNARRTRAIPPPCTSAPPHLWHAISPLDRWDPLTVTSAHSHKNWTYLCLPFLTQNYGPFWSTSKVRHSLFDAPCVAQPCVEIFIAGGRYAIILYIIPNKSTSEEGSRRVNIRSLGFLRAKRAKVMAFHPRHFRPELFTPVKYRFRSTSFPGPNSVLSRSSVPEVKKKRHDHWIP